jgi:hypothetical protein
MTVLQLLAGAWVFSLHSIQTSYEAHTASYPMIPGALSPTHLHLVLRLRMCGAIISLLQLHGMVG